MFDSGMNRANRGGSDGDVGDNEKLRWQRGALMIIMMIDLPMPEVTPVMTATRVVERGASLDAK